MGDILHVNCEMSPYSHLRPSRARLWWEKYSHTIAYIVFVAFLIVGVWLVRQDLQHSQESNEKQTAALIAAKEELRQQELKASCERGNIVREAVNNNNENVRFILQFFYKDKPIPKVISDRLTGVDLVDCSTVGVANTDD